MRRAALALLTLAFFASSQAIATSSAAAPPKPKAEAIPALPQATVTLKVTPGAGAGLWTLRITNAGELPVRIAADANLLSFELTPSASSSSEVDLKKKKAPAGPIKCVLPEDARPLTDEGHDLVIPGKRTWTTSIDPLFYCFGARERAALTPGTSVKPRFGFAAARANAPLTPPLEVTPVGAAVGKLSAAKAIDGDAFMLTEAVLAVPPSAVPSATTVDGEASRSVTLSVPDALDAARGVELATEVTLTNNSDRPITLLYRPDMMMFTVSSAAGTVTCGIKRDVAAPIRELFSTVPVKGKSEMTLLFSATCPPDTFNDAGIYRVAPRLDTTAASGRELGIKTWEDIATASKPLLLRVRTPRKTALPTRPRLD